MEELVLSLPEWWATHPEELQGAVWDAVWGQDEGGSGGLGVSPEREKLVLSVDEAAELLGVSRALVYDSIARGDLPSVRLGRRVLVPANRLREWVEGAGPGG